MSRMRVEHINLSRARLHSFITWPALHRDFGVALVVELLPVPDEQPVVERDLVDLKALS